MQGLTSGNDEVRSGQLKKRAEINRAEQEEKLSGAFWEDVREPSSDVPLLGYPFLVLQTKRTVWRFPPGKRFYISGVESGNRVGAIVLGPFRTGEQAELVLTMLRDIGSTTALGGRFGPPSIEVCYFYSAKKWRYLSYLFIRRLCLFFR